MANRMFFVIVIIAGVAAYAQPEITLPRSDCQSCTARHQKMKRLQKTPWHVSPVLGATVDSPDKETLDGDASAAEKKETKSDDINE